MNEISAFDQLFTLVVHEPAEKLQFMSDKIKIFISCFVPSVTSFYLLFKLSRAEIVYIHITHVLFKSN